jgi:exopolyphosphatase/guanosine-5'-triphosphate,3'-diphosphate pyrophosphatase
MLTKMSTNEIVPRWEWRCFAPSLATIAQAVAIPSDAASRESDEIYVLDPRGTESAKIREGVLDIKRLRQIGADGLELWEPVFKARFPLSRSDLAAASAVWPLPLETVRRETYTIEQFIEEVISLRPDLRVVPVHKSRRAFTFAGCIAELVRLAVESRTLESFSLEHEDPTRILAALLTLGLDGHANTNYSLGLRRALGVKRATTDQQEGSRHG